MSSNITLSASVRSNLLSLQNTASLLDTTQTRLATGNKVNSALDNPTNYFTASSLNSRASDLGNLLDGVSNAIQTIQAANDGITSIQKLVNSAKATANQAQQLSEGSVTTVATRGTVTAGSFSTTDVSSTGSPATAGAITANAYSAVDLSSTNTLAFTIKANGQTHNVSLDNTLNAVNSSAVTGDELATAINLQLGGDAVASSTAPPASSSSRQVEPVRPPPSKSAPLPALPLPRLPASRSLARPPVQLAALPLRWPSPSRSTAARQRTSICPHRPLAPTTPPRELRSTPRAFLLRTLRASSTTRRTRALLRSSAVR